MKSYLHFLLACIITLTGLQLAYSIPLNGNYTVGSGGDYPTINAAVAAADTQGVSGPVVFRILNGIYNESNIINHITGTSSINTVTFESFSGNPDSVTISSSPFVFRLNGATAINIRNLKLGNIDLRSICQLIKITGNKFTNTGITQIGDLTFGLDIINNTGLSGITLTSMALIHQGVTITDNVVNSPLGFMDISSCNNLVLEDNKVNSLNVRFCTNVKMVRNEIEFYGASPGGVDVSFCKSLHIVNNFFVDNIHIYKVVFRGDSDLVLLNNTFRSEGALDTTVNIYDNIAVGFKNNIVINNSGNHTLSYNNNTGSLYSNFNIFYNGTNSRLIAYNGTSYNDLASYQLATGLDGESIVREITFQSPSDLHLAGVSIGDPLLVGAPDPFAVNDIDEQPRNPLYPYRGADEADTPLPVELAAFTSTIHDNDVILNWSTSNELNNSGFDIERSVIKNNVQENWIKIGFVAGHGTQSTVHNYSFNDNGLNTGKYNYRLKQTDFNGNFEYYNLSNEVNIGLPQKYELSQNFPNPFNPSTKINYSLSLDGRVLLKIFDISGREISTLVNTVQTAGYYSVKFDAANLSSGIYYYILTSGNFSETKKMIVVK